MQPKIEWQRSPGKNTELYAKSSLRKTMPENSNPFKQLVKSRAQGETETVSVKSQLNEDSHKVDSTHTESANESENQAAPNKTKGKKSNKKRGRPATGKRSDPGWLGRTYYVRQATDLDVEEELLNLKREGVEIDKSELVDSLLGAWVKWRNGEQANILLGRISPRRK